MPLISIVMPVYNTPEAYLRGMLAALAAQTERDYELLVTDDASDAPHVAEILREAAANDPRIHVTRLACNSGVSAARNAALECACGKYLAFADADDLVEPDYFERLAAAAEDSEADLVMCGFVRFRDGGSEVKRRAPRASFASDDRGRARQFRTISFALWNKLLLRERCADLRFDTRLQLGEDVVYMAEAFLRSRRSLAIPYCGYRYRANPCSATSRAQSGVESVRNAMIILPALTALYGKYRPEPKLARAFRAYGFWHFVRYGNKFGRMRDAAARRALWGEYRALFPALAEGLEGTDSRAARLIEKHLCGVPDPAAAPWSIFLLRLALPFIS